MKTKHQQQRRGVALVITLLFVVLISGVIVAWSISSRGNYLFARSYSEYFKGLELERAAVDQLLSELSFEARETQKQRRELISTGGVDQDNVMVGPVKWGWSDTPSGRVESRNVLLRRSSDSAQSLEVMEGFSKPPQSLYSVFSKASSERTDDPESNSRVIQEEKWRKPGFLDQSTNFGKEEMPQWVYLNSQAEPVDHLDLDSKGRFAYLAYDTSGLMDMNIAGAPKGATVGYKGRLFGVDFSLLPSQAEKVVDRIIQWRLPSHKKPDDYMQWLYGSTFTRSSFSESFLNKSDQGVLYYGTRGRSSSENMFLSRSDLLDFLKEKDGSDLALYFRHGSVEALRPELKVLSKSTYISSKRVEVSFYKLSGEKETYMIESGDPFFQRKFPLSRLEWFNQRNEDGSLLSKYEAAVQRHFGLKWDGNAKRFVYVSPEGTGLTPATQIKTLTEVMDRGREPDFFEWLKAGIKADSLGQISGYGRCYATSTANANGVGVRSGADKSKDCHILQIGCNIMDQWDSDDLPAIVETGFSDMVKPTPPGGFNATNNYANANQNVIFGIENLPYLNELIFSVIKTTAAPSAPYTVQSNITSEAWLQFELWNPHQNPTSQIRGYGGKVIASGGKFGF